LFGLESLHEMDNTASSSKTNPSSVKKKPRIIAVKKYTANSKLQAKDNSQTQFPKEKASKLVLEYNIDSLGNIKITSDAADVAGTSHEQPNENHKVRSTPTIQGVKKTSPRRVVDGEPTEILNSKGLRPPPVVPKPKKKNLHQKQETFVDENGDPLYAPVIKIKGRTESELSSPVSEASSHSQTNDERRRDYPLEPFYALPEISPHTQSRNKEEIFLYTSVDENLEMEEPREEYDPYSMVDEIFDGGDNGYAYKETLTLSPEKNKTKDSIYEEVSVSTKEEVIYSSLEETKLNTETTRENLPPQRSPFNRRTPLPPLPPIPKDEGEEDFHQTNHHMQRTSNLSEETNVMQSILHNTATTPSPLASGNYKTKDYSKLWTANDKQPNNIQIERIEPKDNFEEGKDAVDHHSVPPQTTSGRDSPDDSYFMKRPSASSSVRPYTVHLDNEISSESYLLLNTHYQKDYDGEYIRSNLRNHSTVFELNSQPKQRDSKIIDAFEFPRYPSSENLNNNNDLVDGDRSLKPFDHYKSHDENGHPSNRSNSPSDLPKDRKHNKSFANFIRSAKKSFKRRKTTSSTSTADNNLFSQKRQDFYQKEIADV